ncbi:MAG TPA: glycosyltransferase [Beijerinckiaceae bacterium]|jgi:glycosyltransferase involved in cell wall biosynthesis
MRKVSIVIPSYNHERYVLDALRSAAAQSYPEVEIVVVDDGSSDRSVALIEAFAAGCERPVKLLVQSNAGAHAAIERGISVASGDVIAILNSDDLYARDRLSEILAAAGDHDDFMAFTGIDYIDENGRSFPPDDHHRTWYARMVSESDATPGLGFGLALGNFAVSTSNFVFSRRYRERVGAFAPYRAAHDLDFLLRGIFDQEPIFVRKALLRYRLHPSNTMKAVRGLVESELTQIFGSYFKAALASEPSNRLAPGSSRLMVYLSYFLNHRTTWFSDRTFAETTGQTVPADRIGPPTEEDAWALLAECQRLAEETKAHRRHIRSLQKVRDRLREQYDRAATIRAVQAADGAHAPATGRRLARAMGDRLKLVALWPAGWFLKQAGRRVRPRIPHLADHMSELGSLIDQRQYRAFAKRIGGSIARVPGWLARRARAGHGTGPASADRLVTAKASPQASAFLEIAPSTHDGPVVVVLGPADPDALAATRDSLRRQTFPPREVRERPGDEGFECGPGDLVCLVAPGARLDPTALELLAAALVSVPDCRFAAASAAPQEAPATRVDASIAACLIPGRVWREFGERERFLQVPGSVLKGAAGHGLLLPIPLATWTIPPRADLEACTRSAIRAAPDQWQRWPGSPLDGAARIEEFIGRPRRSPDEDARPHLLVIVPWLPVGGSEIILLELLEHISETWRISIVTMLPGDHAMHAAFARITDGIYHAGEIFDAFRLQALISGLITARNTRILLSSNSGLLHRMVPELKADHPDVAFIDLQHNDLATGLIRSAVDATTSLERHVAVSRRVGEALVLRGVPRERVTVVPNGVDMDLFDPRAIARSAARASLAMDEGVLLLAFVGRFSEEKRVGAFADIVGRIRTKVPVRAVVVGEGDEETHLRERIGREDLPITIIRHMPRSDLARLYAAADLLVLTSSVEGMPMVVLEAMATGCPVAATDVGDVRRLVEPGLSGLIAPVDRPQELADAIVAAAIEPGRLERMRIAARAGVADSGMTKAAMLEGYDRLLKSVPTHGRPELEVAHADG